MKLGGRWLRSRRRRPATLERMPAEYRERLSMSLADWLVYHHDEIVFKRVTWMGVRTLKNPLDCWIYQEILHEVRPDVVVEIGSLAGGSTLFLAHMLDAIGGGSVLSIDVDRSSFVAVHPRIHCLTGDSADPSIVAQAEAFCGRRRVLVIHDGDHTREHVVQDLEAYARLVSVGSYLIVEDSIVDLFESGQGPGTSWAGPLPAIDEFLRRNPGFEIDRERERYLLTYNPHGFLRRAR